MSNQDPKQANGRGIYAGTWLPKTVHKKLKAVGKKHNLTIAEMLGRAARKIVREGRAEA